MVALSESEAAALGIEPPKANNTSSKPPRYTYHVSHDLFLRAMGLVYFAAIFSNYVQWPGLFGKDGLEPAEVFLESIRRADQSSVENFLRHHTIAWFSWDLGIDIDTFFEGLCLVNLGIAASAVLGFGNTLGFAILWLSYLALQHAGQTFLGFQWDILLLEAGALAILWAPVAPMLYRPKEERHVSHSVMWLLRFLLFKLMFMSGIVKLQAECPTWLKLTALDYHYATQCVPTPVAWYAHQLPPIVQQFAVAATYLIEIPLTLFIISPFRQHRHIAAVAQIFLQLLIVVTGNYNFFNFLTMVLCLPCVDDTFWQWIASKICCSTAADDHERATRTQSQASPVRLLGWNFAENHGLSEVLASFGHYIDVHGWWLVSVSTITFTLYSVRDMFSVEIDSTWLNLTKSELSKSVLSSESAGLLSYGLLNGVTLHLRWDAARATSYTQRVVPWSFAITAFAIGVNNLLDLSRSVASAAPKVAALVPFVRKRKAGDGGLRLSRPDGERCCSLKCLRTKTNTTKRRPTPRGGRSHPPLAAAVRRIAAGVVTLLRIAAVWWIFGASCVTFRSLDRNIPRSLPRLSLRAYSSVAPYRMVSSYGLFRRMTGVGQAQVEVEETFEAYHALLPAQKRQLSIVERPEVVIEGLYGRGKTKEWKPFEFPWKPGDVFRAPDYIVPYQPRLDWQMWFAALTRIHQPLGSRNHWFSHLVVKLFDGSPAIYNLLETRSSPRTTFPTQSPQAIRAMLYKYDFTRANVSWNLPYINYQQQSHLQETARSSIDSQWWSRTRPAQYMPKVTRTAQVDGSKAASLPQMKAMLANEKGWRSIDRKQQRLLASNDARQRCSSALFQQYDTASLQRYFKGFNNRDLCMVVARSRSFLLSRGLCSARGVQSACLTLLCVALVSKLWAWLKGQRH